MLRQPSKPLVRHTVVPQSEKESGTSNEMFGTCMSLSSDEDLRAIEVQLEELLEPEEPGRESKLESRMSLPVYYGEINYYISKMFS